MTVESLAPQELLHRSATELLHLAISTCETRFGAVRLGGETVIASDPAQPLDAEESLALQTLSEAAAPVVFQENDLPGSSPEVRFYAAVKVLDSGGAFRGTLAIADDHVRSLTELQQ